VVVDETSKLYGDIIAHLMFVNLAITFVVAAIWHFKSEKQMEEEQ